MNISLNGRAKGFTIVELLIVVVVIAILAAITIVAYNGIQDRARQSAAQSAVSQATKKIHAYAALNSDQFPNSLAQAEIQNTNNNLEYTGGGSSYCLTGTSQNVSFYQSSSQPLSRGACSGHARDGVAVITNYFHNPKPNSTSYASVWDGGNTGTSNVNVSSSWSESGRANRITFPSTISSTNGGPTLSLSASYLPEAGQRFTIAASFRLISGTASIANLSIDRNSSSVGVVSYHASAGHVSNMSTGQTYRVRGTFTADATAAAPSNNLRFYVNIDNKSPNTIVEFADIDLYPGDYQPDRRWGSGDSNGWIWNGVSNNSSSRGVPL